MAHTVSHKLPSADFLSDHIWNIQIGFWQVEQTACSEHYLASAMPVYRTISSSSVSAQPSLATVPEGSAINAGLSAGMPAMQFSSEALVPNEDLSSMSVEELQAELIRTRQAFHSAGAAPLCAPLMRSKSCYTACCQIA